MYTYTDVFLSFSFFCNHFNQSQPASWLGIVLHFLLSSSQVARQSSQRSMKDVAAQHGRWRDWR